MALSSRKVEGLRMIGGGLILAAAVLLFVLLFFKLGEKPKPRLSDTEAARLMDRLNAEAGTPLPGGSPLLGNMTWQDEAANELWSIEDLAEKRWRIHLGEDCVAVYPPAEHRNRSFLIVCNFEGYPEKKTP